MSPLKKLPRAPCVWVNQSMSQSQVSNVPGELELAPMPLEGLMEESWGQTQQHWAALWCGMPPSEPCLKESPSWAG